MPIRNSEGEVVRVAPVERRRLSPDLSLSSRPQRAPIAPSPAPPESSDQPFQWVEEMIPVEVGNLLFKVNPPYRNGAPPRTSWVVVTKVGRKWATYADPDRPDRELGRFDMERMAGDSQNDNPSFYRSEEDWRNKVEANRLWWDFRRKVERMYERPAGLGSLGVRDLAMLLGIRLEEPTNPD